MRFNTQKIPDSIKTLKVGNVYPVRGGRRGEETPRLWILVAVHEKTEKCSLLGINADGEIIGAVTYYKYTLAKWPVIGECTDIGNMTLTLQLF